MNKTTVAWLSSEDVSCDLHTSYLVFVIALKGRQLYLHLTDIEAEVQAN